jgi:hypothetical protein
MQCVIAPNVAVKCMALQLSARALTILRFLVSPFSAYGQTIEQHPKKGP